MSKEDFKYYQKIKNGSKSRYFYTKEEYDAYMNNKLQGKSPFKAVSRFLSKFGKKPISETKIKVNDGKSPLKSVSNFLSKFGKKSINDIKSKVNDSKSFIGKLLDKTKKIPKSIDTIRKLSAAELEDLYVLSSNAKHKSKYIYKEKLPNGKFRYFYSEKDHETYLKKLQYQKDSPSFMSKIKRTLDLTDRDAPILTEEQDTEQINEKYFDGKEYQLNCGLATTAYELRRRGYDVEAKPDHTGEGITSKTLKKYYEDPKVIDLRGGFISSLFDKGTEFDKPSDLDRVTKSILKNNPPGSRGNIMVNWKGLNSGHSMIYEVDASNKIIIRDAQVATARKENKEHTPQLAELMSAIDGMRCIRTDNLKLKPGILEAVNAN